MACSPQSSLTLYETYTKLIIDMQLQGKTIDSKTYHNDKRLAEKGLSGKKNLKQKTRNGAKGTDATKDKVNGQLDTNGGDDELQPTISYKDFQKK